MISYLSSYHYMCFVLTFIIVLTNFSERVENKITRFTENINNRVEKIEREQRELSFNVNKTASYQDDMGQEIKIMKNVSKQSKEDVKQYQSMTDKRLDKLENKTRDYDAVISNITTLDEIQATLNETRNIVQYYHPLGLSKPAGNIKSYLDNSDTALSNSWFLVSNLITSNSLLKPQKDFKQNLLVVLTSFLIKLGFTTPFSKFKTSIYAEVTHA